MFPASPPRLATIVVAALLVGASPAGAQCPDGTPPPCRTAVSASAPVRRPSPPLNDKSWIVVPFTNAMHVADLDWLRDASVNLLSLDLSRWTDINVVDDKRILDLLRELPANRATQPLTLNDGLTLARRAGAGKLVMGDYFRVGSGVRIVTNVFDVKTGAKLRSATRETSSVDSILPAFGPLARDALDLPAPLDAKLGAVGTNRTDAYQSYLMGVRALYRFDLADAKQWLTKALALDSNFALAHYQLTLVYSWDHSLGDSINFELQRTHASAALRLGAGLPPRERGLINGLAAQVEGDYPRACNAYSTLIAHDSADAAAWDGLGECSFHDDSVMPLPGDTLTGRFRGNWNTALKAFRQVLDREPDFHPAFVHILDILKANGRVVCLRPRPVLCNNRWDAFVLRDHDTLQIVPVRLPQNVDSFQQQYDRAIEERARRVNLELARTIARQWVDAAPDEDRPHYYLGYVASLLGDTATAYQQFGLVRQSQDSAIWRQARQGRFNVMVRMGKAAQARALLDTIVARDPDQRDNNDTYGPLYAIFGKLTRFSDYLAAATAQMGEYASAYYQNTPRVLLGVPRAQLNADERRYLDALPDSTCRATCKLRRLTPSFYYAPRAPRTWWPPMDDTMLPDPRLRIARGVAVHDTAYLRRAVLLLDSAGRRDVAGMISESGELAVATEGLLALHDTVGALREARFFVDSVIPTMSILDAIGPSVPSGGMLWPRMMLLRADLAMALKQAAEARFWYTRVADLWAEADPDLQPTVQRIKAALASLGPVPHP